ncbi:MULTISPECIES: YSIRK-type signal peptide-containing protein [Sphingobacterium]
MSIRKKNVGVSSSMVGNTFFLNSWCERMGAFSGRLIHCI